MKNTQSNATITQEVFGNTSLAIWPAVNAINEALRAYKITPLNQNVSVIDIPMSTTSTPEVMVQENNITPERPQQKPDENMNHGYLM